MERFLIVKTSALGDVIQTFPVISYLRHKFPHAKIDWVVEMEGSSLVRAHPDIDRTLIIKTRQWRKTPFSKQSWQELGAFRKELRSKTYDCVFDLQGNVKSGLVTMQAKSKHKVGFGWQTVPERPNVFCTNKRYNPPKGQNIRDDYLFIVQQYFGETNLQYMPSGVRLNIAYEQKEVIQSILENGLVRDIPKVMVCPGSAWANKQLTEKALIDFLLKVQTEKKCAFLFVWGSQSEKELVQRLQQTVSQSIIVERLALPTLQNLMAEMDLVITMDSLPLHLAGTTSTATFSVFGASSAWKYKPKGDQHQTMQGTCPYGRTFEKRCPILRTCPTGSCIRGLTGNDVFTAFNTGKL